MKHNFKSQVITLNQNSKRNIFLTVTTFLLITFSVTIAAQQQPDKIKRSIDLIKKANYSQNEDYHTDGQRTVWIKSYKRWTPSDFDIMQKEAADILKFLHQAVDHNRVDVLEQLLPDYYRYRGSVKAFAMDIINSKPLIKK